MPAGITQYLLKGGPCDGKTGDITSDVATSGQLICGNHVYKVTSPVQVENGREVFKDHGPVPAPPPPPKSAKAHGGWHDVRVSINQHMPKALRTSHHNTQAALRSLSRARKVRL